MTLRSNRNLGDNTVFYSLYVYHKRKNKIYHTEKHHTMKIVHFLFRILLVNFSSSRVSPPTPPLPSSQCFGTDMFFFRYIFYWNLQFIDIWTLSVPDEGSSWNAAYALYTFLLISLGRYPYWWTISPQGYYPPSNQCFGIGMVC